MQRISRFASALAVATAVASATPAAGQVVGDLNAYDVDRPVVTGRVPNTANAPPLDLPEPPPRLGTGPAARPIAKRPMQYSNGFHCLPDSVGAPPEKITIHGQYDMPSARAVRPGPKMQLKK